MKYLICIVGLCLGYVQYISAQCDQTLVDKAAMNAGPEAIYIRDFKVKLSEGTMENPSPVGHFPVYLNEGIKYRFTIANDERKDAFAILQLLRRDKILGSTYNYETEIDLQKFDIICEESATYQILISFNEGQPGCAAAVLSMILQDSMTTIEPGVAMASDSAGTIYLFIDNEMHIAATGIPGGYLDVSISNGEIFEKSGIYLAQPDRTGEAIIKVDAYKKNGDLNETDSILYLVEYPPLPKLQLPGMQGNVIYKNRLPGRNSVELDTFLPEIRDVYELVEFTISREEEDLFGVVSNGLYITQKQIDLIQSTPSGGKLYLLNSRFSDPEGKIHFAPVMEIFIED
jgi:hypothetical protein